MRGNGRKRCLASLVLLGSVLLRYCRPFTSSPSALLRAWCISSARVRGKTMTIRNRSCNVQEQPSRGHPLAVSPPGDSCMEPHTPPLPPVVTQLRQAMIQTGQTYASLARITHVPRRTVMRLLGEHIPSSVHDLDELSRALGGQLAFVPTTQPENPAKT